MIQTVAPWFLIVSLGLTPARTPAEGLSAEEAKEEILLLGQSVEKLVAASKARGDDLQKSLAPLVAVTRTLAGAATSPDLPAILGREIPKLKKAIRSSEKAFARITLGDADKDEEKEKGDSDKDEGEGDEEAPLDDETMNLLGHWDNVKYHGKKLDRMVAQAQPENTIHVGQVTSSVKQQILEALATVESSRDHLVAAIEKGPASMMYRKLFLTQLAGFDPPARTVRAALDLAPPWWDQKTYKAVSTIVTIHETTRNQLRDFTPAMRKKYSAFGKAMDALLTAVDEVEGGARRRGENIRVVYDPSPSATSK